jgi:hypothetical protein
MQIQNNLAYSSQHLKKLHIKVGTTHKKVETCRKSSIRLIIPRRVLQACKTQPSHFYTLVWPKNMKPDKIPCAQSGHLVYKKK